MMLRLFLLVAGLLTTTPLRADPRPLRIGLAMNQDPGFVFTQSIMRGTELAAAYIKSTYGRDIVFVNADTGTDPEKTQLVMRDLVRSDVDYIIGDIYSSQAAIGAMIAEQAGKVYMLTTSASSEITQGRKYIFRTCYSDQHFAETASRILAEKSHKSATVVYDSSRLYGTSEKDAFAREFARTGQEARVQELNRLTFAYEPHVSDLRQSRSDAVFLALDSVQAMVYMAKMHLAGIENTAVIGSSRFGNPRIEKAIQKLNPSFPVYWLANAPLDLTQNKHFGSVARAYQERYKAPMNALGSLGFDAVMIFYEAVKDLPAFSQDQLADNIRAIKHYKGLSADFSFGGQQDPRKSVFLRTLKDGGIAEVEIAP